MKKMLIAGMVAAAVMAPAAFADTPTAPAPAKPIVVKDKVTVKATIEAIDKTNRTVTLKGPKGNLETLVIDEAVDRFDALKVGDKVKAEYFEQVAYELQPPGAAGVGDTIAAGAGSFEGAKPGGAVMKQSKTTVTIKAIDMETPAVTVETSDGSIQSYRVRKRKNLDGVKVGDKVMVTHTTALAISVEADK